MSGFIDLHCHWLAGIDDGAKTPEDGVAILRALGELGFARVIATPHMRPGLFDNTRESLQAAFDRMQAHLVPGLPAVELSSEHYFDDVIFTRIVNGEALPYPGERAVLLEFYESDFPLSIDRRLADLRVKKQLVPVIAHPERYQRIWRDPDVLERLVDAGAAALLDSAALVGKYGRKPKQSAEELLERGLYHAACSDAHRVSDLDEVAGGIRRIEQLYGQDEVDFLFRTGPLELLSGRIPE
ncbi:MAG: protein tyrosine phosphatase [Myxococcales bacterium]|nr:protein tyrosine phosphatase [Myxococcales bacterium]